MAEQLICNQQVVGSTPTVGFRGGLSTDMKMGYCVLIEYGRIPEWPKGTDCKSAGDAFEGSNPSPSTTTPEHIRSGVFLSYAKAVRILLHPLYSKLPGIFAWEFFIPLLCISSEAP